MKKRQHIIASIIIASTMMPTFSQAQNTASCSTCSATPQVIQSYIGFLQQSLSALNATYDESKVSPGSPFGGQFGGESLIIHQESFLKNLANNIIQREKEKLAFITSTMQILAKDTITITKNRTQGMKARFSPQIQRDVQKLQQLDQTLDVVNLQIGRSGLSYKTIHPKTHEALQSAITSAGIFDTSATIDPNATYNQIIRLLNKTQTQIQHAIIEKGEYNPKKLQHKQSNLMFSQTTKESLKNDYACVRTQKCNRNANKVGDVFGKARQTSMDGSKDAIGEFVYGRKRLKAFFNLGKDGITAQEKRRMDARRKEMEMVRGGIRGKSGNKHIQTSFKTNFSKLIETDQKNIEPPKKITSTSPKAKLYDTTEYKQQTSTLAQALEASIEEFNTDTRHTYAIIASSTPHDNTSLISASAMTLDRVVKIIQKTEKQLISTCELQCQNKGGKCQKQAP